MTPLPKGFSFSAAVAGIKASGAADLALAVAPDGASAAAIFTRNLVVAAPVVVGRRNIVRSRGRMRAVIVNSGNANCATGAAGIQAAGRICAAAAKLLRTSAVSVFPSSTGIIGQPLPAEKIRAKLPELVHSAAPTAAALQAFARAILTTDTRTKTAFGTLRFRGKTVTIAGVAKGAGMIHPNMATMLVYLFTDVDASPAQLKRELRSSAGQTFNRITVDGDTSTNDTVLLMASGASGVPLQRVRPAFAAALARVCSALAQQILSDGEGVQHVVEIRVTEARSRAQAECVARTVAHSLLVKTALAGADPNWGRIIAAAGRAGTRLDAARLSVWIGEVRVCRGGGAVLFDAQRAHRIMRRPQYSIRVSLGVGRTEASVFTTDLTAEYVHINADYST